MQVGEVLSGVDPGRKEIEIVTGLGGGDCGYEFQTGADYFVYAYKNSEGRLETGICTRTRPLAQATEDIEYLHAMSSAPPTGEIHVRTGFARVLGKAGVTIIAERAGIRSSAPTNSVGEAVFTAMPPGEYRIHAESDGDLPDDPKAELHAKGCLDVTLFRTLRLTGRVMTSDGLPAARVKIQIWSTQWIPEGGGMTDQDGHFELRIYRPGQYYLGVNLNSAPNTSFRPWFYPGTEDPVLAGPIEFSGKPETRAYDFTLPKP